MRNLTQVLLKKKLMLSYESAKRQHLFDKQKRLGGKILSVIFNKFSTFFEVTDFVKTSKKHRSNVVDIQVKDIFQYNLIGICIGQKKDIFLVNTSYIIRNTFDKVAYEMNISLYSPVIEGIFLFSFIEKLIYITHNKYYYLRKKPLPMSTIFFDYVTDMYEQETKAEKISIFKIAEKQYFL